MNIRTVVSVLLALGAAYICLKLVFWIISNLFSIIFGVAWFGLIVLIAVPFYFMIQSRLRR